MEKKKERVMVAALDWGLGHATRTVPLIRRLLSEGHEVVLSSSGTAFDFYKTYFPELKLFRKPGYGIKYFRGYPFILSMFLQTPLIAAAIFREHFWLKKMIKSETITSVFSDNCYGLWNKKIKTTFITHQLAIICPAPFKFFEPLLKLLVCSFAKKFDECQVPDNAGEENLSGRLSHFRSLPSNVSYIGPLSRFTGLTNINAAKQYDVVVIISGPEPQRSLFENKCAQLLNGKAIKVCIIRGKPGSEEMRTVENITWFDHLPDDKLAMILKSADKIVCRSGYSTIMDLHALKLPALLVPTEGQTEQEYLADFHAAKGTFETTKQDELKFEDFIESSKLYRE